MADPVRCEQVVLGWSPSTLLGRDGFGPVFASAGWQLPDGDRDAGLGARAGFLPQGAAALVAQGAEPPECLAYETAPGGVLLLRKSYARHGNRPGQYVVHALLDPSGRLGPNQLFGCADRGLLLDAQPDAEPSRRWPQVAVPLTTEPPQPLDKRERAVLSVLLDRVRAGRPTVLRTARPELGARTVRAVLSVLPPGLARRISVATFEADPERSGYDLCVAVPPFSVAGPVDVDLDGPPPSIVPGTAGLVAQLADGERSALAGVVSADELADWLVLERGEIGGLSPTEQRQVLAGPLWRRYLDRVEEAGASAVLLAGLSDPGIGPVLADRLADPDPGLRPLVRNAAAEPRGLELADLGRLQDALVTALGDAAVADRLVPDLMALAADGGAVTVASTALADALVRGGAYGGATVFPAFRWHVDTSYFSALSERWLERWLLDGGPLPAGIRAGCRDEADAWAAALDRLLVERRVGQRAAVGTLRGWPERDLGALVDALLACRRVPRLFVLDVLGGFPAARVREVLRDRWPAVLKHAQLPVGLAEALVVPPEPQRRRWFGRPG